MDCALAADHNQRASARNGAYLSYQRKANWEHHVAIRANTDSTYQGARTCHELPPCDSKQNIVLKKRESAPCSGRGSSPRRQVEYSRISRASSNGDKTGNICQTALCQVYVDRRGMGYRLSGFELVGHGGTTSSQATWRPDGILSAVYLVLQTSLQAMQKGLGMGQCDSSRISTEAARLLVKAERTRAANGSGGQNANEGVRIAADLGSNPKRSNGQPFASFHCWDRIHLLRRSSYVS